MSISGASASWTMNILSAGIARIEDGSILRAREWKESEYQAYVCMIGPAHHLPGVAMVVDVAAPGEGLVADPDAVPGGPVAEFAKIGRRPVDTAERDGRGVGADEHQVGSQLAHQIELSLGPVEVARAMRLGHAFEVPEWLEERDLQARLAHHAANLGRGGIERQQVVLEDLDAVEASCRDRSELLFEVAAYRDGRDRSLHGDNSSSLKVQRQASGERSAARR